MKVTTTEGLEFTGDTPQEIVRQMRNVQWNAPVVKRDWMAEVAERVEQMTGTRPSTENASAFLSSLAALNLILVAEQ